MLKRVNRSSPPAGNTRQWSSIRAKDDDLDSSLIGRVNKVLTTAGGRRLHQYVGKHGLMGGAPLACHSSELAPIVGALGRE